MEELTPTPVVNWSKAKLISFRFLCAYLVFYNLPFPIRNIPYLEWIAAFYYDTFTLYATWLGKNVLHLKDIVKIYGNSGDTTFNYIELFAYLITALAITFIWTLRDLKVTNYQRLNQWLRIYIRFSLSTTMIFYGAIKVIKSQFGDPDLDRLVQPIGNASPMGLVWTFMGFSEPYNIFTGGAEMLGGLLLVFPQTTTLGVLVSIGVVSNIAMFNYFYDVPVKIFSSHLLFMCVFLLFPDLKRLTNFFVFNRTIEAVEEPILFAKSWQNQLAQGFKACFMILMVTTALWTADFRRNSYGDLAPKSPLYGIWEVEEFEFDGKALPPLITDENRWRRMIFDSPEVTTIYSMAETPNYFTVSINPQLGKIFLTKGNNTPLRGEFLVEEAGEKAIKLTGKLDNHQISTKLRRLDESKFLLNSRGFHWISEYPFNR